MFGRATQFTLNKRLNSWLPEEPPTISSQSHSFMKAFHYPPPSRNPAHGNRAATGRKHRSRTHPETMSISPQISARRRHRTTGSRPRVPRRPMTANGIPRSYSEGLGKVPSHSSSHSPILQSHTPSTFLMRKTNNLSKLQNIGQTKKQFKSLVLQYEAAMQLLEIQYKSEADGTDHPTYGKAEVAFRFYDEMLRRYSVYSSLGVRLRKVFLESVYCEHPGKFDSKREGDGSTPYFMIARDLKKENNRLKEELEDMRRECKLKSDAVVELNEELELASHLKVKFVEIENALRQNSSINKRLRKANDVLLSHNEDLEEQLLRATHSKFNIAVEEQLQTTLNELVKSRQHSEMLSNRLEETLRKNKDLIMTIDNMKSK